jgi:hypothetical protein
LKAYGAVTALHQALLGYLLLFRQVNLLAFLAAEEIDDGYQHYQGYQGYENDDQEYFRFEHDLKENVYLEEGALEVW